MPLLFAVYRVYLANCAAKRADVTNRSSACGTEKSPNRPVGPVALSGPGDEDTDCCASLRLARNDTTRRLPIIGRGRAHAPTVGVSEDFRRLRRGTRAPPYGI